MKDFKGKIVFISGGASGAGLGQAKVFGREGMKVAIGDVREDALENAKKELIAFGIPEKDVLAIKVDLTNRADYTACADKIEEVFGGPPHLLIQTAGVNSFGPVEASTFDDYDWVMGVDLNHVVNGLVIFVPRMIKAYAHKTEFWVAATSSGGAWMISPTCAPYDAAKAAVNSLIYAYNQALEPYGGGATVLCPANINSNIGNAEKFRPANLKNTGYHVSEGTMATLRSIHATGIDPVELGEILKEGIENGRVIVLPDHHPENWPQQLRSYSIQEEALCLTAAERKAAAEKQAEERRKMFEEMMKNAPKDGPAPAPRPMWGTPEGGEVFGKAREDLDWVDPANRFEKK
ncbi:MAG: SDR family NAD(P)-dependent oxidoreductase [Oscillospiraceae bacterium]|nr:SDR family NAD(P)-dependent oxidoreductase [Oscillospiraceae bacterium]